MTEPIKPRHLIPARVRKLLKQCTDADLVNLKSMWLRWGQQSRLGQTITPKPKEPPQ